MHSTYAYICACFSARAELRDPQLRLAARHCILQALTVVDARANDISGCGAGFFAEIEIWTIFLGRHFARVCPLGRADGQ